MTDRELLELAAKAAGLVGEWGDKFDLGGDVVDCTDLFFVDELPWNPLTDDGDALRLAVKLGLCMDFARGWTACYAGSSMSPQFSERHDTDPCTATRRAIVRAAAALGGKPDA
jgi:hypothetical protein